MTPTNGLDSAPDGSGPESGLTPTGRDAASPPVDLSPTKLGSRRGSRVRMAVLKALQEHGNLTRDGDSDPIPVPPHNGNGHNGHKHNGSKSKTPDNGLERMLSRGKSLLPPSVRARLKGDFLPQVAPSMMRRTQWTASWIQVLVRLYIYSSAAFVWALGTLWEKLRGRDCEESRAIRLRLQIEKIGGTAVKLGQQMAMRIDMLPYEYTVELSKMLDRMVPFPAEYAIQRIETFLGRPHAEVFHNFDRTPIGSASVACVFSGYLDDGAHVAIKVRRPGIGRDFVADCSALGLVLKILEFFTVIRPGLAHNFLFDFRHMLLEELDFTKECRYTELFRRRVEKRMTFVSAPNVYPELSCDDILVTEFVEGIWLREMINAVEHEDEEALALMREQGIYPELVARRLLRANQFGVFENLLFHADPHPSNVVVQRDSRVVFIDFGACGAYTSRERNNWRQLAYYHEREDVGRMVQSAVALLEPLPPIDIDEFSKRVELVFWDDLYAFKSHYTQWWERTSAKIWIRFLELARQYQVPLTLSTLRMIRSTLMYETIAARLFSRVNAYHEHKVYNKSAGRRAKVRVRKEFFRYLIRGPRSTDYLKIEQLLDMGNRTMYLAQRWLDTPPFRFSLMVDKFVYAFSVMLRGAVLFVFFTMTGGFGLLAWRQLTGAEGRFTIWQACIEVLSWHSSQLLVGVVLLLNIRRVMIRLFDKDVRTNTTGLT
jgi:predicted unusual protein kinase regulating ubiquinone biosynthesis (AarF/ABC1/UbiB family)